MSKKVFSIFMPIEFLAALIAAAVFCAVLAPFFARLKKEQDEAKKRKIRRNMVLILLLPIFAAIAAIVLVMIALTLMGY